jgi:hypothetical protein
MVFYKKKFQSIKQQASIFAHILHLFLQVLVQNERKGRTFLGRDLDTTIFSYDWCYKTKKFNNSISLSFSSMALIGKVFAHNFFFLKAKNQN